MENEVKQDLMKDIVISPEGAEEKLVEKFAFSVTMTQNGKFRVYAGGASSNDPISHMFDTKEKAVKAMAQAMALSAGMLVDPVKTIEAMFKLK